jgi:hypothetical protein
MYPAPGMSNVDQFESVFRSAAKARFAYAPQRIRKILVVTDMTEEPARAFTARLRGFLESALSDGGDEGPVWREVVGAEYDNVEQLLALVETEEPDLICTYRHLHSEAWGFQYSLGEYLDVLSQATDVPVLAVPHPDAQREASHAMRNTDVVMAITDHLTGSDKLVNMAARFTQPKGRLWLTHVEDEPAFERIIEAISKIPTIDTAHARDEIQAQLLKEPHEYVATCREGLSKAGLSLELDDLVVMGHHLSAYRRLVGDHEVDLLVMNTKDEDQLAMHGMAYPLAIELRGIPLLLL